MKIIDTQGRAFHPRVIGEVPTGRLVWVDQVNGNDDLAARGRLTVPFTTLTAAKDAALSGDTIMVLPGTYEEDTLFKSGVNWHFMSGAKVVGQVSSQHLFAIEEATTCQITGSGEFEAAESALVLLVDDPDADVSFSARSMTGATWAVRVFDCKMMRIEADSVSSDGGSPLDVRGGKVIADIKELSSSGAIAAYFDGGEVTLRSIRILASGSSGVAIYNYSIVEIEAFEIHSYDNCVYFDAAYGALTIRNARLISDTDIPVYIDNSASGSPPGCRLWNCFLKHPYAGPSVFAPDSYPSTIGLYGQCTATTDVDTTWITKIGSLNIESLA